MSELEAQRRAAAAERDHLPPDDVEAAEARKLSIDWNAKVIRVHPARKRSRLRVWVSLHPDRKRRGADKYTWHCPACGRGGAELRYHFTRWEAVTAASIHSRGCAALLGHRVAAAFAELDRAFDEQMDAAVARGPELGLAGFSDLATVRYRFNELREELGLK